VTEEQQDTGQSSDQLASALEAILFSSHRPLKLRELQQALGTGQRQVEDAARELRQTLEGRGVMLQWQDDLVHLVTRPHLAPFVRRALRPEVTGRLSPAAYETLAIVAYQQPVTRARIEEIRGVNSDGVLANLELRDLVSEMGREATAGQPKLYGTTMRFLQVMGLESLEQLPSPPGLQATIERDLDGTPDEPAQEEPAQEEEPAPEGDAT
jgi:segregation and condensation protein B